MPVDPIDTDITAVTASIEGKFKSVWSYQGKWKKYKPDSPDFSDLFTMKAGFAYMIDMKEAGTLTITAASPTPVKTDSQLSKGQNFLGFKGNAPMDIKTALASIDGSYSLISTYENGVLKTYDPNNPESSDLLEMKPGQVYSITVTDDCEWTLPEIQQGRLQIMLRTSANDRSARTKPEKDVSEDIEDTDEDEETGNDEDKVAGNDKDKVTGNDEDKETGNDKQSMGR